MLLCAIAAVVRQYRRLETERKPVREEVERVKRLALLLTVALIVVAILVGGTPATVWGKAVEKAGNCAPAGLIVGTIALQGTDPDVVTLPEQAYLCGGFGFVHSCQERDFGVGGPGDEDPPHCPPDEIDVP